MMPTAIIDNCHASPVPTQSSGYNHLDACPGGIRSSE